MSLTSKVSPILREHILILLKSEGIKVSNAVIEYRLHYAYSLRSIQEATQKMTKEGTLSKVVENGTTYYSITDLAAIEREIAGNASDLAAIGREATVFTPKPIRRIAPRDLNSETETFRRAAAQGVICRCWACESQRVQQI